ncbi:hypothetical protein [Collimonas sp.]|jgi:hypothetical protein|uniref:hypothetical protein n=1 Tax=Collimonas sp. TaxID=1963772 RepID=UPI002B5235E6|nr:hypothetical protein [Collimonas sp.]HWW05660.1 hypothetical protein [Collimonas sp.]
MENIGDRIKVILIELDGPERGKQTKLAKIAGCTKALIGQLMRNPGQELGYPYAKNIEKHLGYRVDWILNGTLPKFVREQELAPQETNDLDELVELTLLYRQATGAARIRLMEFARSLEKVPPDLRKNITIDKS